MTKTHLDDLPELRYYVLSLSHSPGYAGKSLWWGPNDSGYVEDLQHAGLYTSEQIKARSNYYNDGKDTLAVREDIALNEREQPVIYVPWQGAKWWCERVQPKEATDAANDSKSTNPV